VTAEEIKRYGWRTLADVLRSVRGFYTAYDRDYTYMGVRGFLRSGDYNSRILLLVNGHRLNENVYDGAQIGTEFPLDLDLIDRIEIVRGPSSSLFGTNAVFGVINVITRRAQADALEVSGGIASFMSRAGRITATGRKGQISALLSGSLYRSAGQEVLFFPEFATQQNHGGFAEDIDGDRYGKAFADLQYGNYRVQGLFSRRTKIIPTGSYNSNFNDPGHYTVDTRGYVDASYHRSLSSKTDLDAKVYYDSYDSLGAAMFGGSDPATRIRGVAEGHAHWIGSEATIGRQIGRHRITLGGEYEHNLLVDMKTFFVGHPPILNVHHTPWLAAVYGEAELNLNSKISVRAGGRFDHFDSFGAAFSPRVAVIYSPNSRTALKYIFGRAFRAPNAYESYYEDTVVIEEPIVHLKPEEVQSHELVLEHSFTPWLKMTADGFYNNLTDLIDQQPDPTTGLNHFVNSGQNRGRGLEFELEAKRSSGLTARASYTLADARNQIAKLRLANSPLSTAKLNATLPLWQRGFTGVELLYSSAQRSYQGTRVPPAFLTNLTLSTRELRGGWQFSGSCYNAFDRRWYAPPGPELLLGRIEQDGRSFRFQLTYTMRRKER
jgi:iron complex outermembrane receptor protein